MVVKWGYGRRVCSRARDVFGDRPGNGFSRQAVLAWACEMVDTSGYYVNPCHALMPFRVGPRKYRKNTEKLRKWPENGQKLHFSVFFPYFRGPTRKGGLHFFFLFFFRIVQFFEGFLHSVPPCGGSNICALWFQTTMWLVSPLNLKVCTTVIPRAAEHPRIAEWLERVDYVR